MDPIVLRLFSALKYLLLLVICGGFLGIGMQELVGVPWIVEQFEYWGFPIWTMYVIGFIQVAAAILTFYQPTRVLGCLILLVNMLGAVVTHIYAQQYDRLSPPIVLALLIISLIFIEKLQKSAKAKG